MEYRGERVVKSLSWIRHETENSRGGKGGKIGGGHGGRRPCSTDLSQCCLIKRGEGKADGQRH